MALVLIFTALVRDAIREVATQLHGRSSASHHINYKLNKEERLRGLVLVIGTSSDTSQHIPLLWALEKFDRIRKNASAAEEGEHMLSSVKHDK